MIALAHLARALHDASVMGLFGSACLLALFAAKVPELAFEGSSLSLGRRGASLLALVSAPAWLIGTPGTASWLIGTPGGWIVLARLVLLMLLVGAVWTGRLRITAWLSGTALVLIAATGHAARASLQGFAVIGAANDSLHLLTAAYWIGGLCVLLAMLRSRPAAPRLPQAVALFAEWGMITVALLVMTGIINAAIVLLGNPGHDNLVYAGILVLKVILALMMIALALGNHFRLLPRLAQTGMVARLRSRAGWELGLGLAVVGLAALLSLLAPTHQ
ncbi:MAG TPA: CopD family protein [Rhizomicrobium sp.]|nr:CopD family protein [Rhizomicrobium sp.]